MRISVKARTKAEAERIGRRRVAGYTVSKVGNGRPTGKKGINVYSVLLRQHKSRRKRNPCRGRRK